MALAEPVMLAPELRAREKIAAAIRAAARGRLQGIGDRRAVGERQLYDRRMQP